MEFVFLKNIINFYLIVKDVLLEIASKPIKLDHYVWVVQLGSIYRMGCADPWIVKNKLEQEFNVENVILAIKMMEGYVFLRFVLNMKTLLTVDLVLISMS